MLGAVLLVIVVYYDLLQSVNLKEAECDLHSVFTRQPANDRVGNQFHADVPRLCLLERRISAPPLIPVGWGTMLRRRSGH